jgi:hypothetical protein
VQDKGQGGDRFSMVQVSPFLESRQRHRGRSRRCSSSSSEQFSFGTASSAPADNEPRRRKTIGSGKSRLGRTSIACRVGGEVVWKPDIGATSNQRFGQTQ